MRSILSTIKVTICSALLFLSLSCVAPSNTTNARSDQSADRNRIGGQAGETIHSEQRTIGSRQLGGDRVGGQAGEEPSLEQRTIGSRQLGGNRVGGQAGQQSDQEEPGSEAK
jgi:hypothetical protein